MSQKQSEGTAKLTKKDFTEYVSDYKLYKTIFGIHNEYQIVLKPCSEGFDILLYRRKQDGNLKQIGTTECCNSGLYYDIDSPRTDETWEKAIEVAQNMIDFRLPEGIER
jgi:hypothetical protein